MGMIELIQKVAFTASIFLAVPFVFLMMSLFSMKERGKSLDDENYATANFAGNIIFVLLAFLLATGAAMEIWK